MNKLLTSAAVYAAVTGAIIVNHRVICPTDRIETLLAKHEKLLERISNNTDVVLLKLSNRGTALLNDVANRR